VNLPYHFTLEDVNDNYFNCGHYPEWDVVKVDGPLPKATGHYSRGRFVRTAFATRQEAMDEASRLNTASNRRWREFLAC